MFGYKEIQKIIKNLKECIQLTLDDQQDQKVLRWRLETIITSMTMLEKASSLREAVAVTDKCVIAISKK